LEGQPQLSEGERNSPRAYLYLLADPWLSGNIASQIKFADFVEIMKGNNQSSVLNAPLTNVFTTNDGFMARQTEGNNPCMELLSFRWWHNGNARITIPFNSYNQSNFEPKLREYKWAKAFWNELQNKGVLKQKLLIFPSG